MEKGMGVNKKQKEGREGLGKGDTFFSEGNSFSGVVQVWKAE